MSDSRPSRSEEVTLLYHPLPVGWVGFADNGEELTVHEIATPLPEDPAELADRLLTPFEESLARAQRLRVLAYGTLGEVDFHALPWRGDVLLAAMPVVYGLDLPLAPQGTVEGLDRRRALILADPTGTLLQAPREARRVSDLLKSRGWELHPSATAEVSALQAALLEVDLFHFAGHADFAGRGGWDSQLELAAGSRLTPGAILLSRQVPRTVVLSTCEGSRASSQGVAGLGLAAAFLLAGATEVVGASRPVDDHVTARLMEAFYRDLGEGFPVAEALRRAQLALQDEVETTVWASFRVLER
jgi:CHAT domain-containing protein